MIKLTSSPRKVGVIMLNTRFPRLPGDIGNPDTLPWEVLIRRVEAATVAAIVSSEAPNESLQQSLLATAQELQDRGSELIVTSCGFLGAMQERFAEQLQIPVISSSLMLIPFLRTVYGAKAQLGVITFNSQSLQPVHFNGHYDDHIHIAGVEQGHELFPVISEDRESIDRERACADVVAAAQQLQQQHPEIRAILLECTNLPPYREAIEIATGLPVYDLIRATHWIMEART